MSAMDDLRAAGFSDKEVSDYASEQRATLTSAGFSDAEINQHLGQVPDAGAANKTFARVIGDGVTKAAAALTPAGETLADVGSVYAPVEAALNAGTGLLFGFPAYVGAGLGGLVSKHLLGLGADPKALADTMQKVFTYQPLTERGQRLSGNVMLPLTLLGEGSEAAGHAVTDVAMKAGVSNNTAAAVGAVTDSTLQMLAPVLLGELGRKMGGQTVTNDDMRNTATVIAGPDAPRETVQAVQDSLHATYEKTGIGPFTILEEAHKDPQIAAELADPGVEVPKAFQEYIATAERATNEPGKAFTPTPGDGAPLLDVSGRMGHEGPLAESEKAAIHEDIASQIEETGRASPEQAHAYATLQSEFYAAMAQREGKTPGELFREQPLNVATDMAGELQQPAKPLTPEFKAWFGDSKVVDEQGNPLVVYHGTDKAFTKFSFKNAGQQIIWFTSDRSAIERGEVGAAGRGRVMELYASVKNPASWEQYEKLGLSELEQRGYDGAILKNADGSFDGFAFKPTQLKSVRNRGTFDPNDPNILRQGESKGPRGSYSPTSNTISLFASSDASTFLHESGHQFLTMLERFAGSERGSEMSKADFDALLKHYGEEGATPAQRLANWQSKDVDAQRTIHEAFAKDVEQYFSSGKAPTPKLQAAFDLFKDWLSRVYQSVTGMGRTVSPEVQGVIDRMLGKEPEPPAKSASEIAQRDVIDLRKRETVLQRLLDCVGAA